MAHRPRQGARSRQAVPHRHRALRQRPLLLAQQHPRALPRPPLPRHDHPRQRRGRPPAPHPGAPRPAPAGRHRLLHGRAAGLPVGRLLPRLHGPPRRHLRHRQDLRPRHRPPRKPDQRHRDRSRLQPRRLHRRARKRHPGLQPRLDRLALLPGVVASGALAHRRARPEPPSSRSSNTTAPTSSTAPTPTT